MTAIVDYGIGNLFSLKSSLAAIGEEAEVTRSPEALTTADRVILPGVGAFPDAARKLKDAGIFDFLKQLARDGKPLLGICLGMQLLFEDSSEYGSTRGLGLVPGHVDEIRSRIPEQYDIPHMGWNSLHFMNRSRLFDGIREGSYVYFVHSYAAFGCDAALLAVADYGIPLTAAVQRYNVYGTQFHPEKSGETGLRILRNFCGIYAV